MKRFIIILFILIPAYSQIQAQSSKAIGDAFAQTLLHFSITETDSLANMLIEKYKKNPEVITELGRAYFQNQELKYAYKLLDRAIKLNPKSSAPYIQYGDIYKYYWNKEGNLDTAIIYYDKAIALDAKNPIPYKRAVDVEMFKYKMYGDKRTAADSARMKVVADSAIVYLNKLKKQRPDYPAELVMGDIYNRQGKFRESINAYAKVKDQLEDYQFNNYAISHYFLQEFTEGLRLSEEGLAKFPDYVQFNRSVMYNKYELKDYDGALQSYQILLEKSDSLVSFDHFYAGYSYANKGDIQTATETFNKIYDTKDDFSYERIQLVPQVINRIVGGYKADANYDKAAEVYSIYAQYKKNRSGYDVYSIAQIWQELATDETMPVEEQHRGIEKADSVYALCQAEFPEYEPLLILYLRAAILSRLDSENKMKTEHAMPHYLSLVDRCKGVKDDSRTKKFLSDAYRYLAISNLYNDRLSKAANYAQLYKTVNPSDTSLDNIAKLGGRKRK